MKNINFEKGFTVLELVISIGIFALMSAVLLAKYGTFNQGVLLNNLAYDIALTIRNAQSYGLNVRSASRSANLFDNPYGVHFDLANDPTHFIFFVDLNGNGVYDDDPQIANLAKTTITRGSVISDLCVGNSGNCNVDTLDITFKRPDPNAIIKHNRFQNMYNSDADITITAIDGLSKKIKVRSTGQITVE